MSASVCQHVCLHVVPLLSGLLQDNIVLIGHSAGAHLSALATFFLTDTREELFIEARKQQDITPAVRGVIGKKWSTLWSIMYMSITFFLLLPSWPNLYYMILLFFVQPIIIL